MAAGDETGKFHEISISIALDGSKAIATGKATRFVEASDGFLQSSREVEGRVEFTDLGTFRSMTVGALASQLIADIKAKHPRLSGRQVD
jgi:hypothetical protein